MDKLKNFIDENRHEFETFKAPDALWANISQQLQKSESQGNKRKEKVVKTTKKSTKVVKMYSFSRPMLMRVAASVLILLVLGLGWVSYKMDKLNNAVAQNPQLSETEQYYDKIFQAKLVEVKSYEQDDLYDPDLLTDIQELEQIYNDLRNDLKEDANNEQVMEAMIRNYRIRIELLERMLEEIKTKKKPKYNFEEKNKNNQKQDEDGEHS